MGWGKGTYSSRKASVNNHFGRHGDDVGVGATNIVQYLGLAINTFNDTINNPSKYTITKQAQKPGFEPAHKYKHKTNYRFIIYGDNTDVIYTFGGK